MRYMEIIYHKEFVEAIYRFFKPPQSSLESVRSAFGRRERHTRRSAQRDTRWVRICASIPQDHRHLPRLERADHHHPREASDLPCHAKILLTRHRIDTAQCRHLLVDAGHISVKSDLADKSARQALQQKRKQPYTDEDLRKLESLMYDKFFLKLQSAQVSALPFSRSRQFIIFMSYCSSSLATTSSHHWRRSAKTLRPLRACTYSNASTSIYRCTSPSFRAQCTLPVCVCPDTSRRSKSTSSDAKYKALMRFIDVAIPNFDDEDPTTGTIRPPIRPGGGGEQSNTRFRLPSVFRADPEEYNVDEEHAEGEPEKNDGDEFYEASDGISADIHQHAFEIDFTVDKLQASIAKLSRDGSEHVIGDVVLQSFDFGFVLRKFDMKVDVGLRCVFFPPEIYCSPHSPSDPSPSTHSARRAIR